MNIRVWTVVLACVATGLLSAQEVVGQDDPQAGNNANPLLTQQAKPTLLRGEVEAAQVVTVVNPVEGRRAVLNFAPLGKHVKKGELILELDSADLRDELTKVRIQVAHAQSQVAKLKLAQMKEQELLAAQLAQAELELKVALLAKERYTKKGGEFDSVLKNLERTMQVSQLREKLAATQFDRLKKLQERGLKPADGEDVASLQLEIEEARLATDTARDRMKLLREFQHPHEAALLELAIVNAKLKLTQLRSESSDKKSVGTADLEAATTTLKLAWDKQGLLKQQVERCRIHAPADGVLSYPGFGRGGTMQEGLVVRERENLFHIIELNKLQVRVAIPEAKLKQVRAGQSVLIRVDAFPAKVFQGTVREVSKLPSPTRWVNENRRAFTCFITIEGDTSQLKLGLTAEVELPGENREKNEGERKK